MISRVLHNQPSYNSEIGKNNTRYAFKTAIILLIHTEKIYKNNIYRVNKK
jgi:hypothetical protein